MAEKQDFNPADARISNAFVRSNARTQNPKIACVIPAYNEAQNLSELLPILSELLGRFSDDSEIFVVDDGSQDQTAETVLALSAQYPVSLIQLARNFGKEAAITAGIDVVDADVLLLMDADFQHPLSLIPVFFKQWEAGFDMVYGIRRDRFNEGFLKRHFTQWFYCFLKWAASTPIEPHSGDFRLLDRKVIQALKALPERNRFMKGLYSWVGFKSIGIPFDADHRREGVSRFNLKRLVSLAITGITSFSSFPLRIWACMGAVISMLSIIYGLYIALTTVLFGTDLPGWATLTVSVTFLGGIQLLSIGALGEYIARIFMEVKSRPAYVIGYLHPYHKKNKPNKTNKINKGAG